MENAEEFTEWWWRADQRDLAFMTALLASLDSRVGWTFRDVQVPVDWQASPPKA